MVIKIRHQITANCCMFPADLPLTGSEFQRVSTATEKALVPISVPTMGTKCR